MKKLAIALLVLTLCIGGFGLYRGWLTVDRAKIEQDEELAKKQIHDLGEQVKTKAADVNSTVDNHK